LAHTVIEYYTSVASFFDQIIKVYFGSNGPKKAKHADGDINSGEDHVKPKPKDNKNHKNGSALGNYMKIESEQEDGEEFKALRKYWRHVIRNVFYNISFLIQPPNGLLSSYLQQNAINYS
jgi:hypothetical protein